MWIARDLIGNIYLFDDYPECEDENFTSIDVYALY